MSERTDEHAPQKTTIKRRGILAAAAATVAGMVAKQTSQPVAAYSGGGDQGPLNLGSNPWYIAFSNATNTAAVASAPTVIQASANFFNYAGENGADYVVFEVDARPAGNHVIDAVRGYSTGGYGVYGNSTNSYGVSGNSTNSIGIYSVSHGNHAVYGNLSAPTGSGYAAVYGSGNGDGTFGVIGDGYLGSGVGVLGKSNDAGGTGVKGTSDNGFPVVGNVTGIANPAAGVVGAGTVGPGVQGQSLAGHGLVGTTNAPNGHAGLIGNATSTGGIGLMGIAPNYGTAQVGHAGEFYGNVKIYGGTFSSPAMQTVAQHAGDGSYRALSGVLSPESWVEDYGRGTLAGGKAEITLDPDFAALVHTDDYHAFLTAEGPQQLYVSRRSTTGFSVVAMIPAAPTGGGLPPPAVTTGTFSWRVVAKRKDITGARLAKVAAPSAPKTPAAFAIPETPAATPPPKQPATQP